MQDAEHTNLGTLPVLKLFEEERHLPLVDLRVPALLATSKTVEHKVKLRNISPKDAQLRCDVKTTMLIRPGGKPFSDKDQPIVRLRTLLPLENGPAQFVALGRLIYITPRSSAEIALGMEFTKMSEAHQAALYRYIGDAIAPK